MLDALPGVALGRVNGAVASIAGRIGRGCRMASLPLVGDGEMLMVCCVRRCVIALIHRGNARYERPV